MEGVGRNKVKIVPFNGRVEKGIFSCKKGAYFNLRG